MDLAGVSQQLARERSLMIQAWVSKEQHFSRWVEHPSSSILHHDQDCCERARLWFLAYARSMETGNQSQFQLKAPTWLSQLFTWGPSKCPIFWCQLVRETVIDCGVFAALAREVFLAQGHEAHPAQALLSYDETCTRHWKDLWKKEPKKLHANLAEAKKEVDQKASEVFPWIGTKMVYHELCVVEWLDGIAKVYDSTWGNWYEPHQRIGFGALLAIRTECPRVLRWGNRTMSCGEWMDL